MSEKYLKVKDMKLNLNISMPEEKVVTIEIAKNISLEYKEIGSHKTLTVIRGGVRYQVDAVRVLLDPDNMFTGLVLATDLLKRRGVTYG